MATSTIPLFLPPVLIHSLPPQVRTSESLRAGGRGASFCIIMPSLSPEEEKTPEVAAENLLRQQEGENEDQILILTMQKYLTSDDWIAVMRKYMDVHASTFIFAEEECFTQAHFDVFREFQGIAEAALESVS